MFVSMPVIAIFIIVMVMQTVIFIVRFQRIGKRLTIVESELYNLLRIPEEVAAAIERSPASTVRRSM